MDYPLLLSGEKAGMLRVEQQGLYTCMEVSAGAREGLLRVWVQGGGREAYLGILQPGEGGMYLRRRLSRRELADFPQVIEQASDRQLPTQEEVYITKELAESIPPPSPAPAPETFDPAPTPEPEPKPESAIEPPALIWREQRDGSLVAKEGNYTLLALPARLRSAPQGADLRRIGGREYLVFRY